MTWRQVWQRRLAAHWLSVRATHAELTNVVGDVCGIHAQVAASAELSMAARIDGLRQSDVRTALWTDRTIVKTYGLRGTVHILPSHELPFWLAALREKPPPRAPN
jgi:hypothetical protein